MAADEGDHAGQPCATPVKAKVLNCFSSREVGRALRSPQWLVDQDAVVRRSAEQAS